MKIWKEETKSLPYYLSMISEEVNQFHEKLDDRATKYGWKSTYTNIILINLPTTTGTATEQAGLPTEQVSPQCVTYVGKKPRQYQNSFHMYQCAMDTLTKEVKSKILA